MRTDRRQIEAYINLKKRQVAYYKNCKRNGKSWRTLYYEIIVNRGLYGPKEFLIELKALATAMSDFGVTEYSEVPRLNELVKEINETKRPKKPK